MKKQKILGVFIIMAFISLPLLARQNDCWHGRHMNMTGPMHFNVMDTNKDGKISQKEWKIFHDKLFKERDVNKDGFISQNEMKH